MGGKKQPKEDFSNDSGLDLLHNFFCILTTICAVTDFIIVIVQTFVPLSEKQAFALHLFEQIILMVFVLDIIAKWYNGFRIFWRNRWNIPGLIITLILIVGNRIKSDPAFRISCKVLRMLRINRCFTFSQDVIVVAHATKDFIKESLIILIPFLVIMLGFATYSVHHFTTIPLAFGNLQSAFYTLFICVTQDGWVDIYNMFKEDRFTSLLYFISFISCGIFVIAIIEVLFMTNLTKFWQEEKHNSAEDSEVKPQLNAIFKCKSHIEKVETNTNKTTHKKPLEIGYPKKLTAKTHEDLICIMSTIQKNQDESCEIQRELEKILKEVNNNPANKTQDHWTSEDKNANLEEKLIEEELGTGDILTCLIHLDQAQLLDPSSNTPHLIEGMALHFGTSWPAEEL